MRELWDALVAIWRPRHDRAQQVGGYPGTRQYANSWLGIELLSPAILGDRIADDLAMSNTWFFAAFSASLVVSAVVGPRADRTVDAIGGREVLAASNLILASWTRCPGLRAFANDAVAGLADPRRRNGRRSLRHGVCGAWPDLWAGSPFSHHRYNLAGRICQHGGMAAYRVGRQRTGLARDLPRLGWRSHRYR